MSDSAFCLSCEIRKTCIKICDKVEALLPKPQGGSDGRKIKFFDPLHLEGIANNRAFELKYGKKYGQKIRRQIEKEK